MYLFGLVCLCVGLGVDIWVEDVSGESLKIRERPQVKIGHVAVGISEQVGILFKWNSYFVVILEWFLLSFKLWLMSMFFFCITDINESLQFGHSGRAAGLSRHRGV